MLLITLLLRYLFFVKSLYKKKKYANESGYVLGFLLLFLNIHSTLIFLDVYLDISGYTSLWNSERANGAMGRIIGLLFAIGLLMCVSVFKNTTTYEKRISIYRKIVFDTNRKIIVSYVIGTILLFFVSFFVMAKHLYYN